MSDIKITELDFFKIKDNLKNFLKQQEEFKDYDFDGSAIQVILDILSANTYYNSVYQNMISNESFLDSCQLRSSAVSNSKVLGYTPRSQKSARARVTLSLKENAKTNGTVSQPTNVSFPEYSNFVSSINNKNYIFVNKQTELFSISGSYTDNTGASRNIYSGTFDIFQGIKLEKFFTVDYYNNPDQRFIIENDKVDLESLKVEIKESVNSEKFLYNRAENVSRVKPDDRVYWIFENENGNYEIQFGNDRIGKKPLHSAEISIEYLVSEGSICNKFKNFRWNDSVTIEDVFDSSNNSTFSLYSISTVSESFGGQEKETIDEIKFSAPKYYETQNRAVTSNDYRFLIENKYTSVDSVKTWGGEDNDPPQFGKVFISLKPKAGYFITDYSKELIKNDIIKEYNVVTIEPEIVDPYYTYITLDCKVKYNLNEISYGENYVKNLIKESLLNFDNQNLGKFDSYFRYSKLICIIDDSHDSIKSNFCEIRIRNEIDFVLDQKNTYFSNFNNSLIEGSLRTNKFKFMDKDNCFLEDSGGLVSVYYLKDEVKFLLKKGVGSIDYIQGKISLPDFVVQTSTNVTNSKSLEISFQTIENDLIPFNNQIFLLDFDEINLNMQNISEQFTSG